MKNILFLIALMAFASCNNQKEIEEFTVQHVKETTQEWIALQNKNDATLIGISDIETIYSNDSTCLISYIVTVLNKGEKQTCLLNYGVARIDNNYKELLINKEIETTTKKQYVEWLKSYKKEMDGELTSDEVDEEVASNIYKTIISDGKEILSH